MEKYASKSTRKVMLTKSSIFNILPDKAVVCKNVKIRKWKFGNKAKPPLFLTNVTSSVTPFL